MITIYPGSFDPFHTGHKHILDKATSIFKEVIIVKLISKHKKGNDYPKSRYIDHVCEGSLTDYVDELEKVDLVTVIRGIRNERDYWYENDFFRALKSAKPNIKMIYFFADDDFKELSSDVIKFMKPQEQDKYIL